MLSSNKTRFESTADVLAKLEKEDYEVFALIVKHKSNNTAGLVTIGVSHDTVRVIARVMGKIADGETPAEVSRL